MENTASEMLCYLTLYIAVFTWGMFTSNNDLDSYSIKI